jgi:hypothetical protein
MHGTPVIHQWETPIIQTRADELVNPHFVWSVQIYAGDNCPIISFLSKLSRV